MRKGKSLYISKRAVYPLGQSKRYLVVVSGSKVWDTPLNVMTKKLRLSKEYQFTGLDKKNDDFIILERIKRPKHWKPEIKTDKRYTNWTHYY